MSTSNPLNLKVRQFFGGFLGWFVIASINFILSKTNIIDTLCPPDALLCMLGYFFFSGFTFLLTVGLIIYFIVRRKWWVAAGLVVAVMVNVVVIQLFGLGLNEEIMTPFFVVFLS